MKISQITYTFGNLNITQTITESKTDITKHNDISRFDGNSWEILSPKDEDYTKAIILMHNYKK